jgi:hypothetical protein
MYYEVPVKAPHFLLGFVWFFLAMSVGGIILSRFQCDERQVVYGGRMCTMGCR